MKKIISLLVVILLLSSCEEAKKEKCNLKPIELRQIVKEKETVKSGSFGYFIFAGSGSYSEYENTTVSMCGRVDGSYRFLEFSLDDIRIKIDNSVSKPYIKLNVLNECKNMYASTILDYYPWNINTITIVCSDEMLPERLLPIDITSKN